VTESTDPAVQELISRWTAAEIRRDVNERDALAIENFRPVGPAGFGPDQQQWLDHYRHEQLRTQSVSLGEPFTRTYGNVTVTIATLAQDAEHEGNPPASSRAPR
jgi:hypothetical protein